MCNLWVVSLLLAWRPIASWSSWCYVTMLASVGGHALARYPPLRWIPICNVLCVGDKHARGNYGVWFALPGLMSIVTFKARKKSYKRKGAVSTTVVSSSLVMSTVQAETHREHVPLASHLLLYLDMSPSGSESSLLSSDGSPSYVTRPPAYSGFSGFPPVRGSLVISSWLWCGFIQSWFSFRCCLPFPGRWLSCLQVWW